MGLGGVGLVAGAVTLGVVGAVIGGVAGGYFGRGIGKKGVNNTKERINNVEFHSVGEENRDRKDRENDDEEEK